MTMRYEDALDAAITAVRNGEDIERVLAQTPEHADALRDDLRLTAAVRNYARTVAPSAAARTDANQRLITTLQAERTHRSPSPPTGRGLGSGVLPRLALAAAVVLVAFVAFGALDRDNGPTVEAATIEGVVLGNADGSLTVQTLNALEQVAVPADAAVSDATGASIELGRIEPGEVVVIQAQRRGDSVVARQVARLVANIEAWCNDASDRCEVLTDRLRDLERGCEDKPVACRISVREINQLRMRAAESARLEGLKGRCRADGAFGCEELASFCREHPALCANVAPFIPSPSTDIRERIRQLLQACQQGDASACRQLTQLCQDNAGICPNAPVRRVPDTSSLQPTSTPVARRVDAPAATEVPLRSDAPSATQPPTRSSEPTATPAAQRLAAATATPTAEAIEDPARPRDQRSR